MRVGERNDELMDGMAQRLRQLRRQGGLSQTGLAARAGVTKEIVANLEIGRMQTVSLDNAIKLAKGLGVPLSDLAPEAGHSADKALADSQHRLRAIRKLVVSPPLA